MGPVLSFIEIIEHYIYEDFLMWILRMVADYHLSYNFEERFKSMFLILLLVENILCLPFFKRVEIRAQVLVWRIMQ
jgi:hypothetical protein